MKPEDQLPEDLSGLGHLHRERIDPRGYVREGDPLGVLTDVERDLGNSIARKFQERLEREEQQELEQWNGS